MKSLIDFLIRKGYLSKILLVAGFIASAILLQELLYNYGELKSSMRYTRGLKYAYTMPDTSRLANEPLPAGIADYKKSIIRKQRKICKLTYTYLYLPMEETTNCQLQRIFEQLTDVAFRAYNHLIIAEEVMIQSYVCISIASIYFIIAAITIALITRKGLTNAETNLIFIAVLSAGFGSFFFGLTKIFKQEENAASNFNLYTQHINLEERMRNSLASYPQYKKLLNQPCTKEDTVLTNIIKQGEKEMKDINKINLGFNSSEIVGFMNISMQDLEKIKQQTE